MFPSIFSNRILKVFQIRIKTCHTLKLLYTVHLDILCETQQQQVFLWEQMTEGCIVTYTVFGPVLILVCHCLVKLFELAELLPQNVPNKNNRVDKETIAVFLNVLRMQYVPILYNYEY